MASRPSSQEAAVYRNSQEAIGDTDADAAHPYRRGNILSITMENFQIFKSQRIDFSAALNLIAAPNGSGKSSIANAMAIVFGGTPKTIGKTRDLGEYIRFGCTHAVVEAEIQLAERTAERTERTADSRTDSRTDSRSQSVRLACRINRAASRTVTGSTGRAQHFINGDLTAAAEYARYVHGLGIDVESLSTFIPQERVAAFCDCPPSALLDELLVHTDHSLLRYYALQQELEAVNRAAEDKTRRKELVARNIENMQGEMAGVRDCEQMEKTLVRLECKRLRMEHDRAREKIRQLDASQRESIQRIDSSRTEQARVAALSETAAQSAALVEYAEAVDSLATQNRGIESLVAATKGLHRQLGLLQVDGASLAEKQRKQWAGEEERHREMGRLNLSIAQLEAELTGRIADTRQKILGFYDSLQSSLEAADSAAIASKRRLAEAAVDMEQLLAAAPTSSDFSLPALQAQQAMDRIQHRSAAIQRSIEDLENQRLSHTEQSGQRLNLLKTYHPDTHKAVLWLRQNAATVRFQDAVLEPAFLHISIDGRFQSEVESLLGFQMLSSFLVRSEADLLALSGLLKERLRLAANIIVIEGSHEGRAERRAERGPDREALRLCGIEGVAADYVEARPEYIAMLNKYGRFDCVPVTKGEYVDGLFERLGDCRRILANGKCIGMQRSKYGSDWVISTRPIRAKSYFSFPRIDIDQIDHQLDQMTSEREAPRKALAELLREREEHVKRRDAWKAEFSFSEIRKKIYQLEELRSTVRAVAPVAAVDYAGRIRQNEAEQRQLRCRLTKVSLATEEALDPAAIPSVALDSVRGALLDLENYQKSLAFLDGAIRVHEEALAAVARDMEDSRRTAEETKARVRSIKGVDPGDRFKDLPGSIEEIDAEIRFLRNKLEMRRVRSVVREEYASKEGQLSLLHSSLEALSERKSVLVGEVEAEEARLTEGIGRFLGPIDASFSAMLGRFGFEGALRLGFAEQKWALLILVKFRPDEPLAQLSAQRQSGGEKSLATVLFLLALQSVVPAPFRLVDEINQGMDAINERIVFDILRDMSMRTQFFIITPKLVDGLVFAESTSAIVLYGGPGMTKELEAYAGGQ